MHADQWLHERISCGRFVSRYPHYAAVLAQLEVIADPCVDVMGVSSSGGRFYLHVNRAYFEPYARMLPGVLLHEVHHIVLGHVTDAKFQGLTHPDLLELAMEMSANEGIREPLPPHVSIADYANLGICADQSTLERYELLVEARKNGRAINTGRNVDEHGGWLRRVVHGERDPAGDAAARRLARRLAEVARENGLERELHPALLAGCGTRGDEEMLDLVKARPMEWRLALRRFVGRRHVRAADYRRPNRRFPHRIGEVPGRSRRDELRRPRILIAIDTSGSMSKEVLSEIAAQLDKLRDHASLIVAECDDTIHRVFPYEGRLRSVRGRGGTDFRPVFEPALLKELRVGGVVYFTDGAGTFPDSAPNVPTLWVLTNGESFEPPWGEHVAIPL